MEQRVIALGFFDGVHLGHGTLLNRVTQVARERGAIPAAVTFDTHPDQLVVGSPVPLINSSADRAELMRQEYGIQEVIVAHFDDRMMKMPWEDFVTEYLVKEHGAVHLVAGHDFHFGYMGRGNPERLKEKCAELGIGCDIMEKVERDGITVSSTYIRTLIRQGEMERAAEFLGHPHLLTDTVRHGKRLGSQLGFPTINLTFAPGVIVPEYGVYAARVTLPNGESFPAVTNVGVRPTVDRDGGVTVESYLLGFSGDLYGQRVRVEFFYRLRGEKKFSDLEELRREVRHNAQQTLEYFRGNNSLT